MLFFNVLIGGTDAHAKNYSLLLSGNGALLAPMYDVASGLPYELLRRHGRLAMGVGGENRLGRSALSIHVARTSHALESLQISARASWLTTRNGFPCLWSRSSRKAVPSPVSMSCKTTYFPTLRPTVRKRSPYFKHLPQAPDSNARRFTLMARPAESTFISTNLSRAYGLVHRNVRIYIDI